MTALLCLALVRALLGLGAPKGGGLWGVELETVRSRWQTPSVHLTSRMRARVRLDIFTTLCDVQLFWAHRLGYRAFCKGAGHGGLGLCGQRALPGAHMNAVHSTRSHRQSQGDPRKWGRAVTTLFCFCPSGPA